DAGHQVVAGDRRHLLLDPEGLAHPVDLHPAQPAARSGAWVPMAYGLVIGGAGLLGRLAPGTGTGYWALVAPLVLAGFGTGLTLPAATSAVMEAAPAALGGAASAVLNPAGRRSGLTRRAPAPGWAPPEGIRTG
ncbi:hypothetical protein ABT267_49140, partial [Nonomuraea sp. NPDC001023]